MDSVEAVNSEDGPSAPKIQKLDSNFCNQLPSVIDGFRHEQRKIVDFIIQKREKADLMDYVTDYSSFKQYIYSVIPSIVNMIDKCVRFKNIPLLEKSDNRILLMENRLPTTGRGDSDSRLEDETMNENTILFPLKLTPIAYLIFNFDNDIFLTHKYNTEGDLRAAYYLPVIPMILANGDECLETNPPSIIPSFNPRDIAKNILRMLDGKKPLHMHPWYKNFKGTIRLLKNKYIISGVATILSDDTIEITELPIGPLKKSYEDGPDRILKKKDKKALISDYKNNSIDDSINITVKLLPGAISKIKREGLNKIFGLEKIMPLNSMYALNENNCVQKYNSVEEILQEFYKIRMKYYIKRKAYFLGWFHAHINRLSNQLRFIIERLEGDLIIKNMEQKDVIEELKKRGYCPDPVLQPLIDNEKEININEHQSDSDGETNSSNDPSLPGDSSSDDESDVKFYNYILDMTTSMPTEDDLKSIIEKRNEKMAHFNFFRSKPACDIWREDLTKFINGWDEIEQKV